MTKRILSFLLLAAMLLSCVLPAQAAEEPNPIPVIAKEDRTPTTKGVHHYMLICVDSWDAQASFAKKQWGNHTDGLMLVTVDENANRVMLTSFIRDMLIQRPDGKFGRINNFLDVGGWCYENGKTYNEGFHALVETINGHFDLNIEKFIVVDFRQVENIINAVGGVDIKITNREATYLKRYSISSSSTTPAITEGRGGTYHFSGHAAVIYMRIRKIETAEYMHADGNVYSDHQDYGRTYRDRTVLTSIAESLKNISYDDALRLLDVIMANTVYTNMSIDDLLAAVDLAMRMKENPVENIRMPISNPSKQKENGSWYEITPTVESYNKNNFSYCEFAYDGMATKQVNFEVNRQALHDFLNDSFVVVDDE